MSAQEIRQPVTPEEQLVGERTKKTNFYIYWNRHDILQKEDKGYTRIG
jgi:hypothetical protein